MVKIMKYWDKLMKWVNNATIVDIVCHTDTDGLTAAAQLARWLKKKKVGYNLILGSPQRLRHANFWRLIKNDLVFFVDIPADHAREELKKLNNRANIVIIDHHQIEHDMNAKSIIHYHREFLKEGRYYPSSKQVYDLFEGVDWMACMGLIGDYGGEPWKDFINKVHKKYGFPPCKDDNCFDSPFAEYDQIINSARMALGDKGCRKAFNVLINARDWADFKNKASVLEGIAKQVNDYLEHVRSDFKHNKEVLKKDLVFYELTNPKYRVGSALSTTISTDHPNKTIIIFIHKGSRVNINLRRQDGAYDMSRLAKECAESAGGSGGGHKEAAGATIKKTRLGEFKECVTQKLTAWAGSA